MLYCNKHIGLYIDKFINFKININILWQRKRRKNMKRKNISKKLKNYKPLMELGA